MKNKSVKKTAYMGLMLALSIALSALEGMIPSVVAFPGIKLGLSNIVTMYCLFFMGAPHAFILAALKSGFVLLTRGATAGMLSAAGGVSAVLVMLFMRRKRATDAMTSISGAIAHNLAQLVAAWAFMRSGYILYYAPLLIISGTIMGLITGFILKLVLPALAKLGINIKE
ncbi:MAG: Gx transporter family protein [Oscillospiraceae bacterium]